MFCFGVFFLSNLAAGGKDFICCSGEKKKKKRGEEGREPPLRLLAQSPLCTSVPELDGLGAAGVMLHPQTTALLTGPGASILLNVILGGYAGGYGVLLTLQACCYRGWGSLPTLGIVLAACREMCEQVKCCVGGTGSMIVTLMCASVAHRWPTAFLLPAGDKGSLGTAKPEEIWGECS